MSNPPNSIVSDDCQQREQAAALCASTCGLPSPRFETIDTQRIAGINRRYTMRSRGAIPKQWDEYLPRMAGTPNKVDEMSFGVCWNMDEDHAFDYLTGVAVSSDANLPTDFTTMTVPGGRYAVFTHAGPIATLPAMIDSVWRQWVPRSGLQPAPTPCFERYTPEFCSDKGGTELWVPLLG